MKSTLLAGIVGSIMFLVMMNPPARAQGVGASASIRGTVIDPTGGVIAKASIVATDTLKGLQYTSLSGLDGQYELVGLAPSTYNVAASLSSFQTQIQKDVVVNVGEMVVLDFRLAVATTAQTVEVSAIPPVVETERGGQADTVTQQYIEDLPIDRRDYLSFTLLLPGVSDSTRLMDDQDF